MGSFMTSLEMAGISLTVLKLDGSLKNCLGEALTTFFLFFVAKLIFIDAPTQAPAWSKPLFSEDRCDRCTPLAMACDDPQ
jgi:hypothetical protein